MNTRHGTITVRKGVVTNLQQFRQTLGAYCIVMGGNAAKLLQKQAKLFCEDMQDYTFPTYPDGSFGQDGRSRYAQRVGMDRVRSQIEGIFMPLAYVGAGAILKHNSESIFAAWLGAKKKIPDPKIPNWLLQGSLYGPPKGKSLWTKFREWEYAQKQSNATSRIDLSTYYKGDLKGIHERTRGGNKVSIYFKAMKTAADSGPLSVIGDTGSEILAYSKRVERRVGELKSAWYTAGNTLGRFKSASWIIGNQWGTGILINQLSNSTIPSITVGNSKQGLHSASSDWYKYAIYYRAYAMRVEMYNRLVKTGNADMLFHLASHHGIGGGFQISLPP
jgi:hypothetical protein